VRDVKDPARRAAGDPARRAAIDPGQDDPGQHGAIDLGQDDPGQHGAIDLGQNDPGQDGAIGPARDDEAVRRFIERFASLLVEAGVPRMPARIFVALLAADSSRLTAADLADLLQASPAAVSGGVRYLIQVGLVSREGEPGSRRHHYRVPDDVWNELLLHRDRLLQRWADVLREGIKILGAGTPAGARMAESALYFDFVNAELPRLLGRWREYRAALEPDG
jgi:DNA-binding transcriptional regulator GbsR (MarR family)